MRVRGVVSLAVVLVFAGCGLVQKPNFNRGPAASRKPAPTNHLKAPRAAAPAKPPAPARSAATPAAARPATAPPAQAPAPDPIPASLTQAPALGIPADEIPPIGNCRVWIPGAPSEAQHAAGACDVVQKKVPAGAWVLYRSSARSNEVAVNVYRSRWPVMVSETRYFDYWTGRLLRVE